jgi:hypothetical protein
MDSNDFDLWQGELGRGPELKAALGAIWDLNWGVITALALLGVLLYAAKTDTAVVAAT